MHASKVVNVKYRATVNYSMGIDESKVVHIIILDLLSPIKVFSF